ncbi:MAG TPA: NAD(P)-binding oxidoreductase [Chitinophagaceae bacterium]
MQLLLLGATGRTGKHILETALEHGHTVHALVRDKQKINVSHAQLQLFEGDPLNKTILSEAMTGCDAIVNALNISRTSDWPWAKLRSPENLLSAIAQHIIDLTPQHNIDRYVFISAWGVAETRKDIPGWFRWFIEHSNIRYPYADHERQEDLIKKSSLQFTCIRPAGLTNSKKKKELIVTINKEPKPRLLISRSSVAGFVVEVLEKNLYAKGIVTLSEK